MSHLHEANAITEEELHAVPSWPHYKIRMVSGSARRGLTERLAFKRCRIKDGEGERIRASPFLKRLVI